ncbi:MAG: hypothetical protein QM784_23335 [Polyangiaceae bacterium]
MANGPVEQPVPSSEPATVAKPEPSGSAPKPVEAATAVDDHGPSPSSFPTIEGPTLSSQSSDSRLGTIATLESRIEALEQRLSSTERELAEVYGAAEHLVASHERLERAVRQQRYGRYIVWGTLLLILGVLWMTLHARVGTGLPG